MYDGFSIACGCTCRKCGGKLKLEGHADAIGSHFCINCQDYVQSTPYPCRERTPAKIQKRQQKIDKAGVK